MSAAPRSILRFTDLTTDGFRMSATKNFRRENTAASKEIVRKFLIESGDPEVTAGCFGVPGPVRGGRLKLTNLPWVLDSRELSQALEINHLFLINDLEANGYGIAELETEQLYELSAGAPGSVGNQGLVSAGTGLGRSNSGLERQDARPHGIRRRPL